jgi:hypothetical protein
MLKQMMILAFMCVSSFAYTEEINESLPLETVCSPNECYIIEKELGSGAFGKVYAVKNSQGQKFALKTYIPNGFDGNFVNILSNAKREFEIGQVMDHPNIMKSIEWFTGKNEVQYVLLELVEGEMIFTTPVKSTSSTKAIEASIQLLDALKYGIEKEYIYLDLHGGNVMLTESFETKIVDVSSFFSFDELQYLMHKQTEKKIGQKSLREEKFNRFVSKNKDFLDSIKLSKGTLPDQITKFFLVANFTNIVDMTFDILDKSDMDRELKLELFAAISKVNWSYREDFQTGIELPVNNYFEQVQEVLLQALSN